MSFRLDDIDRKIIRITDWCWTISRPNSSKSFFFQNSSLESNKKMKDYGIIGDTISILNPGNLGFEACFFVMIRTSEHDLRWQKKFFNVLNNRAQVQEAHRLAGDIDYIPKVRVKNACAYDEFYEALISEVKVHNVTAVLSMEEIKSTAQVPLGHINFSEIR